ncbi:unnamed protein product, partial [marine sediment metagenome]
DNTMQKKYNPKKGTHIVMIDIPSLFSKICAHMKTEYFDIFIEYNTRFEDWFETEISVVLAVAFSFIVSVFVFRRRRK